MFGYHTGDETNLVQFRAGRMNKVGSMVVSDARKGLVFVRICDDDMLHFRWRERITGKVEDDVLILPNEMEYVHVPECTTGRAYVLKFKNCKRRLFYWMQEPLHDQDDFYFRRINELLCTESPLYEKYKEHITRTGNMSETQMMQFLQSAKPLGVGVSYFLNQISVHYDLPPPYAGEYGGEAYTPSENVTETDTPTAAATLSQSLKAVETPSTSAAVTGAPLRADVMPSTSAALPSFISDDVPSTSAAARREILRYGSVFTHDGKLINYVDFMPRSTTFGYVPHFLEEDAKQKTGGAGRDKCAFAEDNGCVFWTSDDTNSEAGSDEGAAVNFGRKVKIVTDHSQYMDISRAILDSQGIKNLISLPPKENVLCALLPDDNFKENIMSAEFKGELYMFFSALKSAVFGEVFMRFDLPLEAIQATFRGDLKGFFKALELPVNAIDDDGGNIDENSTQ